MLIRKVICTMSVVVGLMAITATLALAWPDQAPDKATISGPGLWGEIQITDPQALLALKLGTLEDLDRGPIDAPKVGDGYKITRWFYGGTFNFAQLIYYPERDGSLGVVYWDDGPDLTGSHTPFHQKWLNTKPEGDAAMAKLIGKLGAQGGSAVSSPNTLLNPVLPAEFGSLFGTLMPIALIGILVALAGFIILRFGRNIAAKMAG